MRYTEEALEEYIRACVRIYEEYVSEEKDQGTTRDCLDVAPVADEFAREFLQRYHNQVAIALRVHLLRALNKIYEGTNNEN